jgi:hypothetical protein
MIVLPVLHSLKPSFSGAALATNASKAGQPFTRETEQRKTHYSSWLLPLFQFRPSQQHIGDKRKNKEHKQHPHDGLCGSDRSAVELENPVVGVQDHTRMWLQLAFDPFSLPWTGAHQHFLVNESHKPLYSIEDGLNL